MIPPASLTYVAWRRLKRSDHRRRFQERYCKEQHDYAEWLTAVEGDDRTDPWEQEVDDVRYATYPL